MDRQYLDYLLNEWARYHFHNQSESIGYQRTSSTYRACKALETGAVAHRTDDFIDNTPDYITLIDKALERLTDTLRQIITIEYLGTGRRKDKAKKINITNETYSTRLSRARRELINLL